MSKESNNEIIPLEYSLDSYVEDDINTIAYDDFYCDDSEIFFFGKIIDSASWMGNDTIDETKYYSYCPACGKLFKLKTKPHNGDDIECPKCKHSGVVYDFRDSSLDIQSYPLRYAYLECFEEGFVLRLFQSVLDYSARDCEDYTTLHCEPEIVIEEVAREYWCGGRVVYYINRTGVFEPVERYAIDDSEYWIINFDNIYDPMSSAAINDIIYNDPFESPTGIEALTRLLSIKAFRTLKKYGFERLAYEMIYIPSYFCDNTKITELLKADYNKIKANFDVEVVSIEVLEAIRMLESINIEITNNNVDIAVSLKDKLADIIELDKPQKIFKYIRNQKQKFHSKISACDYADYIEECRKLAYDMKSSTVLYPSDLLTSHRRTSGLVKIYNTESLNAVISKLYEDMYKAYEYRNGELAVIMPRNAEEIINEGAEQNHCVGNYCERMAKGESVILFVRRTEALEKPYYTLEIRPNMKKLNVVQCRGYGNQDPSPEARAEIDAFLSNYAGWFNTRKFSNIADTNKRIYYKAVRKTDDGRYMSARDNKTEYIIGEVCESGIDLNPDLVAVKGIHIASLEFAMKYGETWKDVAILEVEVNMNDIIVPDAKDQIRASKVKVLREVPMTELGEWGERHMPKKKNATANVA